MMRRCVHTLALSALLACLSAVSSAPALAATSAGPPQWAITSVAGPAYFKPSPNLELEGKVTERSKVVKGLSSTANITVGTGVRGTKVGSGTTVAKVLSQTEVELSLAIEGPGLATQNEMLTFRGNGTYFVTATNVGGESTSGPVTITDALEGEAEATAVVGSTTFAEGLYGDAFAALEGEATEGSKVVKGLSSTANITAGVAVAGEKVKAKTTVAHVLGQTELELSNPIEGVGSRTIKDKLTFLGVCKLPTPSSVTCEFADRVDPGDTLTFRINLNFTATAGTILNKATVSGGGAKAVSTGEPTTRPTPVTSEPVPFGVANFYAAVSTPQAGAQPNFITSFATNWGEIRNAGPLPPAAPHEIGVDLPPGLTGDPLAVPRCNIDSLRRELCPEEDAVGVALTRIQGSNLFTQLVYNITPYPDEPAALAFEVGRGLATARLDTSVLPNANGEYAVHASVQGVNESAALLSSSVTLWGVPALYNGPGPDMTSECGTGTCRTFGGHGEKFSEEKTFMRNQTSCAGQGAVAFKMDSWQNPGVFASATPSLLPTPTECNLLSPLFTPSLEVSPDKSTEIAPHTFQAGLPAGYEVQLSVPQNWTAKALGTPDLRNSTVTLPAGTVASPSAANGLEACSDAQFARSSVEVAQCPPRSEVGKLEIQTPLLLAPLTGQVYLGQPECSPCGSKEAAEGKMTRLFLQAQGSGVRVKLAGRTQINQETGQLTTIFEENPQQPFEKLTLQLDNGPGAPLANPSSCVTATTTSKLVPWSSTSAEPPAEPSSSFQVGGCSSRFAPSLSAGMTGTAQAGAYSPLSVTFSRTDQDQIFSGVTTHTPPGLLAAVSHVTQCGEPQASLGTCGPDSQIGTVATAAGPGPSPFWITSGRAYLTGPYKGAPFGLSIVVPTKAGPFDLGDEHLRAAIYVDPYTSATTVVSDPLPTIKDGIPFQVKTVNVNINRPQFTFNATNCNAMAIGATISSTQGATAGVSSPYQAHNCASLPFSPELTAEAGGHGSRNNGTSFIVKVKATPGQANIAKTFLALPLALSSRLSTIQKACLAAVFEANPASCPEGSNIGMAVAHTPLLNSPLVGPAYLVSHGNAAFPDVEFVLQGEGITLILDGKTDIKKGITYSRFETVPDAPVSTFETVLPAGPHSALTPNVPESENYSLCKTSLVMPTEITGQNGALIRKTTHIALIGCAPAKPTVKIARVKLSGNALLVTVNTSAAGTVRVSGRGLKTTAKKLAAGTHRVRVPLTKAGRTMRRHHKKTTVHISLVVGKQAVAKATAVRL
jgi:hypothetical protein